MIEESSLNINKFHFATGDKALYQGNYYSDKAPGMTFSALPAISVSKLYLDLNKNNYKWINDDGKITSPFIFVAQIATIATSGLLTALAGAALFFVAIKLGAGPAGAIFGALAFGLATPAWGWSTAFFGHASAGSCLFLGLTAILYLLNSTSGKRRDIVLGFISGALLSWAVVIEYTSAPVSVIIAIYGLISAWNWERRKFMKVFFSAFVGAFIFICPLLIYNYAIYGNILTSGYEYTVLFPGMKAGYYGIVAPKPEVLFNLLFSPYKGIFWFSPLLLFVPFALYKLWQTRGQKGLSITIVAVTLYYLLWNSGYVYWTGGGSLGPRFLTPMLPFLCISLAFLWAQAGKKFKLVLFVFFVISFLISLMSVSVSMIKDIGSEINPITEYLIPEFFTANQLDVSFLFRLTSPSFDGTSHLHILPLYLILAIGFIYILWELYEYSNSDVNSTSFR
ncbi:MAG: hypothetical protein DHS20C13_00570 [Thermodesulfobacteriota bacterium]|nr:MAG: hypothetical protein DHS20C13_00570 [Thermodesulfobacteriota bacterium]